MSNQFRSYGARSSLAVRLAITRPSNLVTIASVNKEKEKMESEFDLDIELSLFAAALAIIIFIVHNSLLLSH